MTPESICVSLEMAKRLKEAGWSQEDSPFVWTNNSINRVVYRRNLLTGGTRKRSFIYAAPTAEEILRRLPKSCATKNRMIHRLSINCNGGKRWNIFYGKDAFDSPIAVDPDDSLANAAAAMTCYLVEQGLLSFTND